MYDSWKIRTEQYMMNRKHGRMILEFVKNGPLIWPTIKENGVTRPKKYSELSATEAIQADCDVKATNIILQVLPPEVYALVSNHKVIKELWERIQLLMQGTSSTKQEKECKLYDEFDKFVYKKGESLLHHNVYDPSSSIPQVEYAPSVNQQSDFSQPYSGLINLVFQKGDDLIDAIHHKMSFLTVVVTSRDESWFKDKVLSVQAQENEQILHEEELAFLEELEIAKAQTIQNVITHNAAYQADDLDAYDSDCDEISIVKVAPMTNLSHYGSDDVAEIHNQDNVTHNVINQVV
nr:hypothetical protein [Tanacetum cinerariifolium]